MWQPSDFGVFKELYEAGTSAEDMRVQLSAPSTRTLERYITRMQAEGTIPRRRRDKNGNLHATKSPPKAKEEPPQPISDVTQERLSYSEDGNTLDVYLPKTEIRTLPALMAYCEVDEDVWFVKEFEINKWEVAAKLRKHVGEDGDGKAIYEEEFTGKDLFQVKARLKRRELVHGVKEVIKALFQEAQSRAPVYAEVVRPAVQGKKLLELNPVDHHLGKLAWKPETGADYDIKIARKLFEDAMRDLVNRARVVAPIDRILLILGNDLLQIDNPGNTTTAGTHVDVDSRFAKVYLLACEMIVEVIDKILLPVADVDILMVPGNHDRYTTFHLGEYLKAWYRNCNQVNIDNKPVSRKYYQYGKNLFLFSHGDTAKAKELPQIMASEQKHLWAKTDFRFCKTGHYHRKAQFSRIDIDENYGVQIQICPTLCAADAWHFENGFIANMRRSEAYIYDFKRGPETSLTYMAP